MPIDTNVVETIRPSRRTVVRGAAWSVPVVSMAATAPAFAASCGSRNFSYALDWNTASLQRSTNGNANTAYVLVAGPAGSSAIGVTLTSTTSGSVTRSSNNLQVSTNANSGTGWDNVGNLGGRALMLYHQASITAGESNNQKLAISFDRAVTGLSFSITDIDRDAEWVGGPRTGAYDGFWDRVTLSGTYSSSKAANMVGTGASGSPWYSPESTSNRATDSGASNVKVTYDGTIPANTPIELKYWSAYSGGQQWIYLTDFTWTAKGC